MTIGHCPRDILEDACHEARKVCDHPAKIVPFICEQIGDKPEWRQKNVDYARQQLVNEGKPKLEAKKSEPKPELGPITQEEINSLPLFLRKSWLNLKMITQEQFDAAWTAADEASEAD